MKELLKALEIDNLMHFTRAENIPLILQNGLLPRRDIINKGIDVNFNDEIRLDGFENAVCLSVEFPNYKMFYKLRIENPDVAWAVLVLDANLICNFECAYCYENAGSAKVYNIPIERRMGKQAFLKMFDEFDDGPSRNELMLLDCQPTNPQAEILVFGKIPIAYIRSIHFDTYKSYKQYSKLMPRNIKAELSDELFSPRKDYEYWR